MTRIGIVIPTHNVGPYIYECLRSCIYNDDDCNVEIHIVNDNSTDDTHSEIDRFCNDYPTVNVSVYNTKGIGPGEARNLVIPNIETQYLLFVDGDDLISRRNLDAILDKMDATGADVCCPNIIGFDDTGRYKFDFDRPVLREKILGKKDAYLTSSRDNPEVLGLETSMCMRIFRAEFYRLNKLCFSSARFCEDIFPSRKAFLLARKVLIVRDDYYFYRLNRIAQRTAKIDNSTMDLSDVFRETMDISLERVLDNEQGGWILNRLCEAAVWGASLIPPQLLKEFASNLTDSFERAPLGWWASFDHNADVQWRQKRFSILYLKNRSRKSRERVIFNERYRFIDRKVLRIE